MKVRQHNRLWLMVMAFVLITLMVMGSFLGRYDLPVGDILDAFRAWLGHHMTRDQEQIMQIVLRIRVPRILASVLVGSALSASGAVLQGVFQNPMVSPNLLGVSSGTAFGAVLGILFGLSFVGIETLALVMGLVTMILVFVIFKGIGTRVESTTTLILIGVVISSLFTSFISLVKYAADPYDTLPSIVFWLMGSLSRVSMNEVKLILVPIVLCVIILQVMSWKLNILSFGEGEATAMGISYHRVRWLVIVTATLLTASVVSISGLIGFVGLIVPHICRLLVGANYRTLIPASVLTGGIFLLVVDTLSRVLFTAQIPIGIMTSIIGTPFFILLLIHKNKYEKTS